MKKYIFIFVAFIACVMFNSCSPISQKSVEKVLGAEIKNMKVETLHLDDEFYSYHQDCIEQTKKLHEFVETATDYLDKAKDDFDYARIYVGLNNRKATQYRDSGSKNLKIAEDYRDKSEAQLKIVNKINELHKSGDLYVAKFKAKNRFGKWDKDYIYAIFTYNDDNKLYLYDGEDNIDIFMSAYPKDAEKMRKRIASYLNTSI